MTIYNFNLGIGWASSGVEYAQAYRAKLLRDINEPAKFIFTDMFQMDNIEHMTKNIGFTDDEVIWMYQYFTNIKIAPTTFTREMLEETFQYEVTRIENLNDKTIRYFCDKDEIFYTVFLKESNSNIVERVEYVSRGLLIRKDFFTYTRVFTEYYAPKDNMAYLYQRTFYNEDGTVCYDEIIDGNNSIFRFPDQIFYTKEEFINYFIRKLNLTKDDVVIVDRATGICQSIMRSRTDAKIAVVVHAEHFGENNTTDDYIFWNNFYEYQFNNADKFDYFIVSTKAQEDILRDQFKKYYGWDNINIVTIPVGSIDELKYNDNRKKFGLVTASRLAGEKHIDWLVQSVVKAKKEVPELTFDIYGEGGDRGKIESIIAENNAGDYIKLLGHKKLDEIYKEYELYIAASTSEGFGLTLLEAIGSGLPIIGFDVRYGNKTFVNDGISGKLIKDIEDKNTNELIDEFSLAIVDVYKNNSVASMREASYEIAADYLTSEIEKKWKKFVKEAKND